MLLQNDFCVIQHDLDTWHPVIIKGYCIPVYKRYSVGEAEGRFGQKN